MKEIAQLWHLTSIIHRKAWSFRARELNKLPAIGKIYQILPRISNNISTDRLLILEMEASWARFMSSMKKYAISKRREREVFKYFNAGIESIKKRQHLFIECTI